MTIEILQGKTKKAGEVVAMKEIHLNHPQFDHF